MNEVEKKYNRLYAEMAKYYHLDHKVTTSAKTGLHFISIRDFGYMKPNVTTTSPDHIDNIILHLKENFTYLAPFYKFFHRDYFCAPGTPDSNISLLKDINKVIKKIREEKN